MPSRLRCTPNSMLGADARRISPMADALAATTPQTSG